MLLFVFLRGGFSIHCTPRTRKEFLPRQSLLWLRGRTIGTLRAERHTLTSAEWTSCSACHELLCSRAFLFIVLLSAQHPQIPRFLLIFRGSWPMPLSLPNHSALALFAQRTRIPTSARSIGFCVIWVCIGSRSQSKLLCNGFKGKWNSFLGPEKDEKYKISYYKKF
jgi:hypothetical protein